MTLAPIEGMGYIYALSFSNDMVKVGKSINPIQRMKEHRRLMRPTGGLLKDWWFSKPHPHFDAVEVLVIQAAEALMTPDSFKSGREWFYNIDYGVLVDTCATLAPSSYGYNS